MDLKQNIQQASASIYTKIIEAIKKIRVNHIIFLAIPFLLIYPKPWLMLVKPIIRNWSYYYQKVYSQTSKPIQIILSTNPDVSFQKEFVKNLQLTKGYMPIAYQKIKSAMNSTQKINSQKQRTLKNVILQKKNQIQVEKIINSCFVIDIYEKCLSIKIQQHSKDNRQQLKMSIISQNLQESNNLIPNCQQLYFSQTERQTIQYSQKKQTESLWAQTILLNLKLLQLQNKSQKIKYMIIKAEQNVLRQVESSLLGINIKESYKLGSFNSNKLHILKLHQNLHTYELCYGTYKSCCQLSNSVSQH